VVLDFTEAVARSNVSMQTSASTLASFVLETLALGF